MYTNQGGLAQEDLISRLRIVSVGLVLVQVVCFFVPWVRVAMPSLMPGFETGNKNHADVGLIRCLGGSLCDAFNAVYNDKDGDLLPPWVKGPFEGEIKDSAIYTANVTAISLVFAIVLCVIGSEVLWLRGTSSMMRGLDCRVVLALAGCALSITCALLYFALLHSHTNGGPFMLGWYLEFFGGCMSLGYCLYILSFNGVVDEGSEFPPPAVSRQNSAVLSKMGYGSFAGRP